MKNFQSNLLLVLALALCGLCVFQWHGQTVQRIEIETQNQMIFQKNSEIQNDTNSIATLNQQVEQMDARITEIKAAAATNEQIMISQTAQIAKWQFTAASLTNEIAQYQTNLDTLRSRLKEAYDGIRKQNEAISNLVAQRGDFVKKYNDEVKDRNAVVAKYNELAKRVEKLQSGGQ